MKIEKDHTTYIIEHKDIRVKVKTNHDGKGQISIFPYYDPKKKKFSFTFFDSDPEKIKNLCEVFVEAAKLGIETKDNPLGF